jgi:hypothetical protein
LENISESLRKCAALTQVLLVGKFEVASLQWIRFNPMMQRFRSDAVVLEIDWNDVFDASHLNEIAFAHTPDMLPSDDEIKAIARSHGRDLQWIEH